MSRSTRFLLFADILGTSGLYLADPPRSDLIEKKRIALGHVVRTTVFPYFSPEFKSHITINVFSDTVLVACDNLGTLMCAASQLFYQFSLRTVGATECEELFLLRGGIARGQV